MVVTAPAASAIADRAADVHDENALAAHRATRYISLGEDHAQGTATAS